MKKEKKSNISVKFPDSQVSLKPCTSNIAGGIFLFFSAALGFYLSLQLILSVPFSEKEILFSLAFFALFFTLLFHLKRARTFLSAFLLFMAAGYYTFFKYRQELFVQSSSFLGHINTLMEKAGLGTFLSGFKDTTEDKSLLLLFLTAFYLILLLFSLMQRKKEWFVSLLMLPVIAGFILEVSPSYLSIGCLLTAFLLWDSTVHGKIPLINLFIRTAVPLALYIVCAVFLVPRVSPALFQSHKLLYQIVNGSGNKTLGFFSENSFAEINLPVKSGFTYEQQKNRQVLDNTAPTYNNQTMFRFYSEAKPDKPLYFRGFIGQTYTEAMWKAPRKNQWASFRRKYNLSDTLTDGLLSLPFLAGKTARPSEVTSMSLIPEFSPEFTYLPYGAEMPDDFSDGDNNELKDSFNSVKDFQCFPLSFSSASVLISPDISEDYKSVQKQYQDYVENHYTSWDSKTVSRIKEELSSLPVYSSMPSEPTLDTVQAAAEEIRSFLHSHASYSLSLAPVSRGSNFLDEFLYEQNQGFCVHFATASTLMFRMYGIPARYVSGYMIFPDQLIQMADGRYFCKIPDSSAHAWTEIYIGNGGWVPVDMTPSSSRASVPLPSAEEQTQSQTPEPENPETEKPETEKPEAEKPEAEKSQPEKSEDSKEHEGNNPEKLTETDVSHSNSILSVFWKVFSVLIGFAACLLVVFLLLLLRRTLLFRRRMGYFAQDISSCCLTVFNSILLIWQIQFALNPEKSSDSEFRKAFAAKLPAKEKELFQKLYSDAESICFGAEKPTRAHLRELRRIYRKARKSMLSHYPSIKKWYYLFIAGL